MEQSRDVEIHGAKYHIGDVDALTGCRVALQCQRGLGKISASDFAWVQAQLLANVRQYREDAPGGSVPVLVGGKVALPDLRSSVRAIMALMQASLRLNGFEDAWPTPEKLGSVAIAAKIAMMH